MSAPRLNHSCVPNATVHYFFSFVLVTTQTQVQAGEGRPSTLRACRRSKHTNIVLYIYIYPDHRTLCERARAHTHADTHNGARARAHTYSCSFYKARKSRSSTSPTAGTEDKAARGAAGGASSAANKTRRHNGEQCYASDSISCVSVRPASPWSRAEGVEALDRYWPLGTALHTMFARRQSLALAVHRSIDHEAEANA